MKTAMGRMVSLSIAFIVVASALIPLMSSGALASSQSYVIRPPADFTLDNLYNYGNGSTGLDIYYDPTKLSDDGDVKIYADKAFDTVTSFYGQYNYRITLILAADHDQYVSLLNPDPTETQNVSADEVASNYGYGVNGTIVIEVPGLVPNFEAVLTQQISDIVMRTELIGNKYNVPDWFSVGLSNYLTGNISNSSQISINALASQGKLMTIDQMESTLENSNDPNDLSVADAQASMLMEYIGTYYGNSTINRVLTDFGPTGDMDKSFQSVTGVTPDEINTQWQDSLNVSLNNLKSQAIAQRIDGYVLDPDGNPVSNQSISFIPSSGGQPLLATTDGSGFYLLNLSSGTFTAHLSEPGYATINDVVTLNNSQVLEYNFTLADPTPVPSTVLPANSGNTDNGTIYVALAAVNAIALVLIAFVFWRTRK
jgi:hypothetical protein